MCVMTLLRNQHPHSSSSLATFITSSAHTNHTVDLDDLGRDHILGKRTSKLLEVAPSCSFVLGHIHLTSFTNCFNWFTKAQVYTANNKQGYSFFVVSIIRHVKLRLLNYLKSHAQDSKVGTCLCQLHSLRWGNSEFPVFPPSLFPRHSSCRCYW